MNRFALLLCFFALAWNTALASVGGFIYCIDKSCDEQPGAAAQAPYLDCVETCSSASKAEPSQLPLECEQCIDIQIDADELKNSNSSSERIAVKAPLAIEWMPLALLSLHNEEVTDTHLLHLATVLERGALGEYASTVQFRI